MRATHLRHVAVQAGQHVVKQKQLAARLIQRARERHAQPLAAREAAAGLADGREVARRQVLVQPHSMQHLRATRRRDADAQQCGIGAEC